MPGSFSATTVKTLQGGDNAGETLTEKSSTKFSIQPALVISLLLLFAAEYQAFRVDLQVIQTGHKHGQIFTPKHNSMYFFLLSS